MAILSIRGLSKGFPGVQALSNVDLTVERGEVHAIVGENGAGKSTLIKVLAGIYRADSGEIEFNGKITDFKKPSDAAAAGISVVHQELKLVDTLSVTENIFLGNLMFKNGLVDWKNMNLQAQELLKKLGIAIDVNTPVSELTQARKQIVEIGKAINRGCKLLIMDEPSATLTEKELEILFKVIGKLIEEGVTIMYISHRLEEIFSLAKNVTVLRDGVRVATRPVSELNRVQLINMMVGRELGNEFPKEKAEIGEIALEAIGICKKGVLSNISFCVHRGEVLGIAGLVGSGRTELARAVLGIDKIDSGEVRLFGKSERIKNFRIAIRKALGLVPEDRKVQGLILPFAVSENICLVAIERIIRRLFVRDSLAAKFSKEYVEKLRIVTPGIDTEVESLSGGNQQKVVIAKWLMRESEILFLDEPTRGVDVGAKTEIYRIINALAASGKAVVMISSELPEILGMCDRIIVMHEGSLVGEMRADAATQESILALCV